MFINAFFYLSYMKKLCIHPYLLNDANSHQKESIGIISKEEDYAFQLRKIEEEEELQMSKGIKTRRSLA